MPVVDRAEERARQLGELTTRRQGLSQAAVTCAFAEAFSFHGTGTQEFTLVVLTPGLRDGLRALLEDAVEQIDRELERLAPTAGEPHLTV